MRIAALLCALLSFIIASSALAQQTSEWLLPIGVRTDAPGAITDPMINPVNGEIMNAIGVRSGAVDGYGGLAEDKPDPGQPPTAKAVYLAIAHSKTETGWENAPAPGQFYNASFDIRAPLFPGETKVWTNITVAGFAGTFDRPAAVTLEWDASRVPANVSLLLRIGLGEIDVKLNRSFTFLAYGYFTRKFEIVATDIGQPQQPSLLVVPSSASVLVGRSFVVQAVLQNADPANLEWTLTPSNVGRLIVDGTRATYIAPERVPSPPDVFVGASLRGTNLHSECRITVTAQPVFPPKITNFDPKQGFVGTNVRIEGENFGATPGENEVRFGGGAQAVVLAVDPSRTRLWVVVPPNAKTGKITVTTSGGTAESAEEFVVIGVSEEPSFRIKYFEPAYGAPGSHVKIETTGLGPMGQTVYFNGVKGELPDPKLPFSATDTTVYRRVPKGAISGPITISDSYKGVTSSSEPFTVLQPPTVYKMETDPPTYPKKVKVGKPLYIYGSNFLPSVAGLRGYVDGGVTRVRFNGMDRDVDVAYADQNKLMVIVPQGASTGPVKVITYFNNPLTYKWPDPVTGQPYGPDLVGEAETPDSLIIDEPPTITGFTPKEGYEGDTVTISGTNFDPRDLYSNEVRFNNIVAPVVEVSLDGRTIKAVVPFNATTGKISVQNGAGTATSAEDFKVLHRVVITPGEASVRAGGPPLQFTSRVTGVENQAVEWSLSPAGFGSIDSNGLYTPPALLVSPVQITVAAKSLATGATGTAKLTILPPLAVSITPSESTLNAGGAPLRLTAAPSDPLKLNWSITPQIGELLGTENTVRFYSPPPANSLPVESVEVTVTVSFEEEPKASATAKITVRDPLKFVQEPTSGQVTSSSAIIVWETNKPTLGGYRIEANVQPAGDFVFPAGAQPSTKHSINVTGLQPDTIYWYDVVSTAPNHADLRSGPKFFRTKADYKVTVEPAKVTITTSAVQTFTATVTGGAVTRVNWSMTPSVGSLVPDKDDPNKAVYVPPPTKPQEVVEIKIRATSVGDPSRYAEAVVVLAAVGIKIDPISRTMLPGEQKPFEAILTGVQGVVANWEITTQVQGDPIPTWTRDKDNPNKIWVTAPNLPAEAPPGGGALVVYKLRAWADVGGSILQAEAVFNVRRPHKVIIENPPDKIARVRLGEQFSFHARVMNYISSPTVEWEVDPPIAYGTIHKNTGLYTAPTEMPSPPEAIVRARSAENPNAYDEAKVILLPVPSVKLEPATATVRGGKSVLFTATVVEAEPDLNWYVNGVPGGDEVNGIIKFPNPASTLKAEYVAPNVQSEFVATIKAELTSDPGRSYTVTVRVKPALGVKVTPPDGIVRTGDSIPLTAEPVNAERPEIVWEVLGGSANGVVKPQEGNPRSAVYTAPVGTPDAKVRVRVAVKDLSDGEVAYGFSVITVQPRPVRLDPPGPIVIPAGQSFTFRLLDAQTNQPVELNAEFPPDAGRVEPLEGGYYRFTAAEKPPVPAQFIIRASRKEDPKAYADLTVTIVENIVITVSSDREHVYEGERVQFRAEVSGTEDKQVAWKVSQGPGSIDENGLYTAGSVGNQPATVIVTAVGKNQASGQKSITVWPKIPVVVQPPQAELYPGDTQQFAVSGGIKVTWSLRGANGVGSISESGLYTAPPDVSDTLEVPVVATYTTPAGSLTGSALVRVLPPIRIAVKPEAAQVLAGGSVGFAAEVTVAGRPLGPGDEPLTWEVVGGDANGTVKWAPENSHSAAYTAPAGVDAPRAVEVRARSTTANGRFFGSAVIQVVPKPKLSISDLTVVPEATEATLSWTTNAPAVFRVEYGTARDSLDKVIQSDKPQTEHKVVLTGLKPDTEYWFRITASAQDYEPATAGPQSFRTSFVPVIVAVDGPRHNIVDPTSVEIIWSTNVESSSLVEYGLTQEYGLRESSDRLEKEHRILLKELTPGSEYHYRVTSRREGWKEYVSADLTFSLPARPIPPKDLQVAPEVYAATVTWTTDVPAVGTVFYGTDPGKLDAVAAGPSEPRTKHSVRLENLSPATVYYYKVVCEAPGYTKTESQVQSFATFDVDQVLILELGHTLVPPSSTTPTWSAEITWRTNVNSTSVVEYGTDPSALATVSQPELVKDHKVVLGNLVPGAVYTYRVRSEAPGMKAGVSPQRTFAVLILKDAVHILTPPRAENVKASEAEIVWTTDVESDSLVEYGVGGEFTEKVLDENLVTLHRVKLTNLKSSTAYSFRVRSGREGYEPAQSEAGRFTTRAVVKIDTEPRIVAGVMLIDSDVRLGAELPLRFEWSIGDAHDVSAPMVVESGPGRRLRFSRWQDGVSSRERTISVAGDAELKAIYTTQYQLSVQVQPADADVALEGGGWYEAGAEATAAAPEVTRIAGVLYRLSRWELDGEKKPAGVLKVTMDGPHTAVAVYERADTAGPDVVELTAAPNPTAGAKSVTIRAVISDIGRGGTAVAGAEYSIDTEAPAGSGVPMEAEAPPFDSPREAVVASISTVGWKEGSYRRVFVRGRDALGNWGQAAFVDIAVTAETVAPGAVSDLRASSRGQDRILLNWTAPGGDGNVGQAARYDIRISTAPITAFNFGAAQQVPNAPLPAPAGTPESLLVTGLQPDTLYYFALKAVDEAGNWSQMSNVASARTAGPPPVVVSVTPPDASQKVPLDAVISVTFSKPMDATSVVLESRPALQRLGTIWSEDGRTVVFTHDQLQGDATTYHLTIWSARDIFGNEMEQPYSWHFVTIPPVDVGLAITPWPMYRHDPQHTGKSFYIGPSEPEVRWTAPVRSLVSSPAMWKDPDRTVYVGSVGKALYAINGKTGQEKWSYGESSWVSSSPAIAADGTVYIGLPSGGLHAVTPEGKQKWVFSQDVGAISSSPVIGEDGTVYIGDDRGVFAVTPSGSLKWRFKTGGGFGAPVISSPAVTRDGKTVVFGADDGVLYAVDAETGAERWRFYTSGDIKSSPAIGTDGTIYFASNDGFTYAINPADPKVGGRIQPRWKASTGRVNMCSPALSEGVLYIGNEAGVLYCLDAKTGAVKWSFDTGGAIFGSPCVDFNGIVYVASSGQDREHQRVLALTGDGVLRWVWEVGSPITSSPVLGDDGTLYVCSQDRMVALRKLGEVVYGDLTGDGKVQVVDATKALRIALKIEPATEAQMKAADVDGDGNVTVRDVTRILRRAVGLIPDDQWP